LEKGQRSEKALTLSIAEMYLQGVSTRKVSTTNGIERVNRNQKTNARCFDFSEFSFMPAACHRGFDGNLRGLAGGLQLDVRQIRNHIQA